MLNLTGSLAPKFTRGRIKLPRKLLCAVICLHLALGEALFSAKAAAHVVTAVDPLQDILGVERTPAKPKAAHTTTEAECRLDEFTTAAGETLLGLIEVVPVECMDDWFFDDMSVSRQAVFSEENMLYISELALERADEYDSANGRSGLIGKAYVFLHAGYWNYTEHSEFFEDEVVRGTLNALEAFIENPYFQDEGDKHAAMLSSIAHLATLANIPDFFFSEFAELFINRVEAGAYVHTDAEWELVSAIVRSTMTGFFYGTPLRFLHFFGDTPSKRISEILEDTDETLLISLFKAAVDVGVSDRMANLSDEEFSYNERLTVGIPLFFCNSHWAAEFPALLPVAKAEIRRFANHWKSAYKNSSVGRKRFFLALNATAVMRKLNRPHTADLRDEILRKIFPDTYSCGRHLVRAQMGTTIREGVCRTLTYQEALFHSVMGTNKKPALHGDTPNERVENIIFNRDYGAGLIDGLSRYLIPGFYNGDYGGFSYQVTTVGNRPISDNRHDSGYQILRHEFVHYLDDRFNGNPGFPWVEGVAEYLSKENDYEYGIKAARREMRENGLTISDVFNLTLGRRVDYSYSIRYAVIRFFFERYPELIAEWLHGLYKIDTYGLLPQHLQPIGSRYDKEFADWLENVTANNDPLPRIKRKTVDIAAAAVPFMLQAHDPMGQGFVRIINESEQSAGVRILVFASAFGRYCGSSASSHFLGEKLA